MTAIDVSPDRLLTESETAELLAIKPQTLSLWRSTGRYPELRFTKIGRSVRYMRANVQAFINGRTCSSTREAEQL